MINNNFGFLRVFIADIPIKKADVESNLQSILSTIKFADKEDVGLLVLPPLPLTSPYCKSLFQQHHLYDRQQASLIKVVEATKGIKATVAISHYEFSYGKLIQKLSLLQKGEIAGSIEIDSPSGSAFFDAAAEYRCCDQIFLDEKNQLSLGVSNKCDIQLFLDEKQYVFGMESRYVNLLTSSSLENNNICLLASSSGLAMIFENGISCSHRKAFEDTRGIIYDVDTVLIKSARVKNKTFSPNIFLMESISISPLATWGGGNLLRQIPKSPFLHSDTNEVSSMCSEIFNIQVEALSQRLSHTNSKYSILGISGGLDSTLALLVCVFAHKKLGLPLENIIAVTMPGFGTTGRTYKNAVSMIKSLGVTFKEISIVSAVKQHFSDIDHPQTMEDITFENAQARERTQILMDLSNKYGGLVIGTGDLSELALGWCTFNGDHMSMYAVNAGVPKTVIQSIIRWFVDYPLANLDYLINDTPALGHALEDILATPISPELLSPTENDSIAQKTEDKVGPYALHDFFIYHTIGFGVAPNKLLYIATLAFEDEYDSAFIKKWLNIFYKRFFQQQFKRNCAADSPVIFQNVSLNYDIWLMDSDVFGKEWNLELI